jgi:EAL domain-containing protein (putative c-di-GMP-specific phosphodiesterase class I)
LGAELTRAVARREFGIAFQPIVDLESGMVRSAEALARWTHPTHGPLPPLRFLDAIERSGLLSAFTEHILDRALAGAAMWREAGFDFPVAVNVSPRSLHDQGLPDMISTALARYDLPPRALVVEVTETLIVSHLEVVDDVLHTLHDLGVRLALDDFGTGFSSFETVRRVPIDELKIDRAFVARLSDPVEAAIVRSTIDLGRGLGHEVVAEGVEDAAQRQQLFALGCNAGQGYLFSHPLSAERLIARLRQGENGVPGRLAAPIHGGDVIQLPSPRRAQDQARPLDEVN